MQIHELNNYSGSLGDAYLAADNGSDTGKMKTTALTDPLNARIDNIIAGTAPSAAEIVDARLGADGVTYPSLGAAIRNQVTDLKSDLSSEATTRVNADNALSARITDNDEDISKLQTYKVVQPLDENNQPTNGTSGQMLRTNGDGTTEWVDEGLPTDEQTANAISSWLSAHPEATTTVQDGSLTEVKFSESLKLKTINYYVTPEMFGAVGDGVGDDSNAIQYAINSGEKVILTKTYRITNTITDVKNIYIDKNAIVVIDNDVDGFYMTGDNNVINGLGTIRVNVDEYTHSVIKVIGASSNCHINDISIEGKNYKNPKGIGIYFESSNGRHFAHRITSTIRNFNIGIHINAQSWCNNFYFNILTLYNNISILIDGDKESSGHYGILHGQCALYTEDGCVIRTINSSKSDSFWYVQVYDTGNTGNNTILLDIKSGYAIIREDDIGKNKYRGNWRSNFSPSFVKTDVSSLKNAIDKSWVTTEAIGNASDLRNPPINFSGSTTGALANIGSLNKTDGVRYTFDLPNSLFIDYLTFVPETDAKVPNKIIIKLESSYGTQEVEIDGNAIGNGRTFLAIEFFNWKYYYECTKIVLEVIGMKYTNSGSYTRLLYFGVYDHYGRILE